MRAKATTRLVLALVFASSVAFTPRTGFTQAGDKKAAAETLFQKGKELMAAGKPVEACPKFEESQRLDPSVGTMLNLARCHGALGRTATAWAEFKEASTMARAAGQADREAGAKEYADKLEPKLSFLRIDVKGPTPGLLVKRDGEEQGGPALGLPIAVDPGKHKIEASAPGYKPWSTTVEVGPEADKKTVEVPALEAAPEAINPAETASNGKRTAAFVLGGVGILGLGAGAVFGGLASSDVSQADASCPEKKCSAVGYDLIQQAENKALLSTIGFAAGGALLGTGVVLFLLSSPSSTATPKAKTESATRALLVPSFGRESGGVMLVGSF